MNRKQPPITESVLREHYARCALCTQAGMTFEKAIANDLIRISLTNAAIARRKVEAIRAMDNAIEHQTKEVT